MSPDQFCFDSFEEGLDGSIVIAIAFSDHRHLAAVLAQDLLVVVRAVLRPAVRVVDAAFCWRTEGNRHLQRSNGQVPFHPI